METPKKTLPLRFGQWHFWTHPTAQEASTTPRRQQLVFCLPPVEGQVAWARNHFPRMPQNVYALEYDQRIGKETMQSLCKYLAEEVTRILEYHRCIDYCVMAYSMGSVLAYGVMQAMSQDLQPKAVMFIDSSPVVLHMIKDLEPPEPEPVPQDPEERREYFISMEAVKVLKTMTPPTPVVRSKTTPHLLLVKASNDPDEFPIAIPEDYGMSQLIDKFEMRILRGTHQTVNQESSAEIVQFFESFATKAPEVQPWLGSWLLDKLNLQLF